MNSEGGHSGEGEYGEEEAGPEDRTIDQTEASLRSGVPVIDSVKIMAETVSVGGLHEEVAREIADEVTHRVKMLVQNAAKLMHHGHGQRVKLTCEDVVVDTCFKFNADDFLDPVSRCPILNIITKINGPQPGPGLGPRQVSRTAHPILKMQK